MQARRSSIATAKPRPTAVIAETTTWQLFPSLWPRLLDEVYASVRRPGLERPIDGWHNVMLYRDSVPNVEVGVLAPPRFSPDGRVIASELPGGDVLRTVHRGDYAGLGAAHEAIVAHAAATGLQLTGIRWEVYGHWVEDPAEVETEIYYLLV